mgnify:CR=1 FL=1
MGAWCSSRGAAADEGAEGLVVRVRRRQKCECAAAPGPPERVAMEVGSVGTPRPGGGHSLEPLYTPRKSGTCDTPTAPSLTSQSPRRTSLRPLTHDNLNRHETETSVLVADAHKGAQEQSLVDLLLSAEDMDRTRKSVQLTEWLETLPEDGSGMDPL